MASNYSQSPVRAPLLCRRGVTGGVLCLPGPYPPGEIRRPLRDLSGGDYPRCMTAQPVPQPIRFGNALRKYRLILGLHQKDLGLRVGATQGQVSAWENGVIIPDLKKAIEIAVVLGRPVEHVFFDFYLRATDALAERGHRPGSGDRPTSV